MKTLFVTGTSGYIGTHLIKKINPRDFAAIYCLTTTPAKTAAYLSMCDNIKILEGTIFDSHHYAQHLASCDTVLHLAAATGKQKPEQYFLVNAQGTRSFLEQCQKAKIEKFIYVSSIAVKFENKSRYLYAQSKKLGEDAVKQSGLNYTILRPTIVIGEKSPLWKNLSNLAKGPLTLVFGKGNIPIQPIYIDDLIDCTLTVINDTAVHNEIIELGGPEVVTFEEFLTLIHQKYKGKHSSVLHLPLRFFIPLLRLIERVSPAVLPLNAGQLSSFMNDGTIDQNRIVTRYQPQMRTVEKMLDTVIDREIKERQNTRLFDECKVFCHHLIKTAPDDYVLSKYVDAHKVNKLDTTSGPSSFDRLLVAFARISPFCSKLADTYSRIFLKRCRLRKKLILLLAVLESSPRHFSYFDRIDSNYFPALFLKLIYKSFTFSLTLLVATFLIAPLHILSSIAAPMYDLISFKCHLR